MSLQEELFRIEEGFWLSGEDHFLQHLDERCLLAFPQMEQMHGVLPRADVARTAVPDRWRDLRISNRALVQLGDDACVISYRADVTRGDGTPYAALIGSSYVRRREGWKLASHQHSPL